VVQLFQEAGGIGRTPEERRELRHRELDLAIDYRLGVDFPRARRDALWQLQEETERRRLRMLAKSLVVRLLPRFMGERRATTLARALMAEYAKVLSPEEMLAFLGPLEPIKDY
jgi:hypothetical protein